MGSDSRRPSARVAREIHEIAEWVNTSGGRPLRHGRPPRQGRARRLLDVLVPRLPAHAAAPARVGRRLPRRRPGRSWACTRPSSRSSACRPTCASAVGRLGVGYPDELDNEFGTWNAYLNEYWPAKYLIDRDGRVRYTHFGEGAYEETERRIRALLGEKHRQARAGLPDDAEPSRHRDVPRLRAHRALRQRPRPARSATVDYRFPDGSRATRALPQALAGRERAQRRRPDARLRLRFLARDVFLVLAREGPRRHPRERRAAAARCGARDSSPAHSARRGQAPQRPPGAAVHARARRLRVHVRLVADRSR